MQTIHEGYWWRPDHPDRKVRGRLTVSDEQLELSIDELFEPESVLSPLSPEACVIHGVSTGNSPVSCFRCRPMSRHVESSGVASAKFLVGTAVHGVQIQDETQALFRDFKVRYTPLDSWKPDNHFRYSMYSGDYIARAEIARMPETTLSLTYLSLQFGVDIELPTIDNPLRQIQMSSANYLRILYDTPTSLPVAISDIMHLNSFLTLVTGRESSVISIQLNERQKTFPTEIYERLYLYIALNQKAPTVEKLHPSQMDSTYYDLSDPERALDRWFRDKDSFSDVVSLFTSGYYNSRYYEQRFLSLCQALETFHRRFAEADHEFDRLQNENRDRAIAGVEENLHSWLSDKLRWAHEPSLRRRLKQLISVYAPNLHTREEARKLVDYAVEARNYYTHYDQAAERSVAPIDMIHHAMEPLRRLLVICIMSELGEDWSDREASA